MRCCILEALHFMEDLRIVWRPCQACCHKGLHHFSVHLSCHLSRNLLIQPGPFAAPLQCRVQRHRGGMFKPCTVSNRGARGIFLIALKLSGAINCC